MVLHLFLPGRVVSTWHSNGRDDYRYRRFNLSASAATDNITFNCPVPAIYTMIVNHPNNMMTVSLSL